LVSSFSVHTVVEQERSYRGLNFFAPEDEALLATLARGAFGLRGFKARTCAANCPPRAADKFRARSNACAYMTSSRK
jgi:hypothetical protein